MRIAGGVLLLLIGIFSLAEGGCVAIGCHAVGVAGSALGSMGKAALENKNISSEELKKVGQTAGGARLDAMAKSASSLGWLSILIRVAGLLCLVAGILFFVNKGKMFGFIAPGVGILAEVLLFAMMSFTIIGLVKILFYGIGLVGATKVGAPAA